MTRKPEVRIGARRRARECATQVLYQLDAERTAGRAPVVDDVLALFWKFTEPDVRTGEPDALEYAETLVHGVEARQAELDDAIQRATQHWRLERMARVDRNIIRVAVFELLHQSEVPAPVAINEAIEIAKKYGTEESGAFVNGILDRIAQGTGR